MDLRSDYESFCLFTNCTPPRPDRGRPSFYSAVSSCHGLNLNSEATKLFGKRPCRPIPVRQEAGLKLFQNATKHPIVHVFLSAAMRGADEIPVHFDILVYDYVRAVSDGYQTLGPGAARIRPLENIRVRTRLAACG